MVFSELPWGYTPSELAAMNLPYLGKTWQAIVGRIVTGHWDHPAFEGRRWRYRPGAREGTREYHISVLPHPARSELLARLVKESGTQRGWCPHTEQILLRAIRETLSGLPPEAVESILDAAGLRFRLLLVDSQ